MSTASAGCLDVSKVELIHREGPPLSPRHLCGVFMVGFRDFFLKAFWRLQAHRVVQPNLGRHDWAITAPTQPFAALRVWGLGFRVWGLGRLGV